MLKQTLIALSAALVIVLVKPSEVDAYGAAHFGYTRVTPYGAYHTGRTVAAGPGGVYAGGRSTGYGYGGAYHYGYGGGSAYGGAYHYGGATVQPKRTRRDTMAATIDICRSGCVDLG